MSERFEGLARLSIARPCRADWDAMDGNEQRRFCSECQKHVHNLAELSADQAEEVVRKGGCVRALQDQRGVLTRDGWVGRALLAGAAAIVIAGCDEPIDPSMTNTGELAALPGSLGARLSLQTQVPPPMVMGEIASPETGRSSPSETNLGD
jgi:hypothetical protein